MPTIYQTRCDRCEYTSEVFPAEYGAVFLDRPLDESPSPVVAGAVLFEAAGDGRIAEQDDPRLVSLAHPLEQEILTRAGYTTFRCAWSGRYVRIRRVVCCACGTIFETRKLTCPPALGCLPGLLAGIGIVVAAGYRTESFCSGWFVGYLGGLCCWGLVQLLIGVYVRRRFRERARVVAGPGCCPHCGNTRFTVVEGGRKPFPCPRCGQPAMTVRPVGMS